MIVLRGVRFDSHCEHHGADRRPRQGRLISRRAASSASQSLPAWSMSLPKRLQIQEKMTAQIASTINDVLNPQGVGVIIKATHRWHDHAWRAQAGHRSRDQPHARCVPRQRSDAAGVAGTCELGRLIRVARIRRPELPSDDKAERTRPDARCVAPRPSRTTSCSAMSARRTSCWCRAAARSLRSRRRCPLAWSARRRPCGWRHHPLPLASRLLLLAHWRADAPTGAEHARGLGRAARRRHDQGAAQA